MPGLFDRFGRPKRLEAFGGQAYMGVNVAVDDSVRRFTTEPTKLRDAIIQAQLNPQTIGDFDIQDLEIAAGEHVKLRMIDVSTLYVLNTNAGQNGTLVIFGSRE